MRKHYNFSKAKRNPYAQRLKQQVTIRLDRDTIGYFKNLAKETSIPYQSLINLYLRECASSGKRLSIAWRPTVNKSELVNKARGFLKGIATNVDRGADRGKSKILGGPNQC